MFLSKVLSSRILASSILLIILSVFFYPALDNGFIQGVDGAFEQTPFVFFYPETHWGGSSPFYSHVGNVLIHGLVVILGFLWALRKGVGVFASMTAAAAFCVYPGNLESIVLVSGRPGLLASLFFLLAIHSHLSFQKEVLARPKKGPRPSWVMHVPVVIFGMLAVFFVYTSRLMNVYVSAAMYFSSVLVFVLLAIVLRKFQGKKQQLIVCVFLGLSVLFSWVTVEQSALFQNSELYWRHRLHANPNDPQALMRTAEVLTRQTSYQNALKKYKIAVELIGKGFDQKDLNLDAQTLQRVNELMTLYIKAQKYDPHNLEIDIQQAEFLQMIGFEDEAKKTYEHVLTITPHQDALANLALVYFQEKKFKQGIVYLQKLKEAYPDNDDIQARIIIYCIQTLKDHPGQPDVLLARNKFFEEYATSIEAKRPTAESFFNLGFIYEELGDPTRAINFYRNALEILPRHFLSIVHLASLHHELGDLQGALKYNLLLTQYYPHDPDAFYNAGVIFDTLGQKDKSRRFYEKTIQIDPGFARAYFMLGFTQEAEGGFLKAKEYYLMAVKNDPYLAIAQYNLGNVLTQIGNPSDAILAYQNAVAANPNYEDALVNLSILLTKQGRYQEAIIYLEEAMLLGYQPPQAFLDGLKPYRNK